MNNNLSNYDVKKFEKSELTKQIDVEKKQYEHLKMLNKKLTLFKKQTDNFNVKPRN